MAEAVDHREGSRLRIISGRGLVTYSSRHNIHSVELPLPFSGTLIDWSIYDSE